ncbi:MAG TPA: hypothetical protein VM778_12155 [Gemmatimonadota bacterium]|nr:hypothetical protein [Gemmatimonadota bacterium]
MRHRTLAWTLVVLATACGGDANEESLETVEAPAGGPPYRVLVEVDRMQGAPPIRFEQELGGARVSLADIFGAADVHLRIVEDEDDLPGGPTIRLADLHGLMTGHSGVAPEPGEWKVHVLVVTLDPDDDQTLGIMFDVADNDDNDVPREAFAVFATAHGDLAAARDPEMLLTTAHELAHAFNVHHTDWEGSDFYDDATIESYSSAGTVRWSLSRQSLDHFANHHPLEVQPGSGGLPFGAVLQAHLGAHQSYPGESYELADPSRLAMRRGSEAGGRVSLRRGITGADLGRHRVELLPAAHPLRLRLHAPKARYELGEPVVLTVELHNAGEARQEVVPLLNPEYGFLAVHVRLPGRDEFRPYRPPVLREARQRAAPLLAGSEALYAEAKVFFGASGWTFQEPGEYLVLADYPSSADPESPRITSDTLRIVVRPPTTPSGRRAVETLRTDGRLGLQQGLFLYLEGGDHLEVGKASLEEVVAEAPDAPQAAGARLALARAALHPTLDPNRRTAPDVDAALRYVADLEGADLPPLTLMRIQGEIARALEASGRPGEARLLRSRTVESVDRRAIPWMDRSAVMEEIE